MSRHGTGRHRQRRRTGLRAGVGVGAGAFATLLSGSVAEAGSTVTVTTLSDAGAPSPTLQSPETLADAISYQDAHGGGEIVFKSGLSGTIKLTTALPNITQPVYITGPGASKLTIDGGGASVDHAIFLVNAGASASSISGLTLTDGRSNFGGAILAYSNVDLNSARVIGNAATIGGGVFAYGADLNIHGSTIAHNSASSGGAIGGLSSASKDIDISYSTVSDNVSSSRAAIDGLPNVSLIVAESTVSGNTSGSDGGGIYAAGTLIVRNSTIDGNTVSAGTGGGIDDHDGSSGPTIFSSIVAQNRAAGGEPDVLEAAASSPSFSLIGNGADTGVALVTDSTDIVGTASRPANPGLSKLSNNGGPTATMLPLSGSPAINHGDGATGGYDQRGFGRDVIVPGHRLGAHSNGIDIGAVEVQVPPVPSIVRQPGLVLTLAAGSGSCVASFDNLPVTFRSVVNHRAQGNPSFGSVAFSLDPGTSPGQRPNARSGSPTASPTISLQGYTVGEHTLRALVTITRGRRHHRHRRTVSISASFAVCGYSYVL